MRRRHKLVPILLFSTAPFVGACSDNAPPPPDNQVAPQLLQLRGELWETPRSEALQRMTQFRPICDADGYPLVGNVANKATGYQLSEFCAEVRKQ
jgi:hypothetical protein